MTEDHWTILEEYKHRLTNNHTHMGVRTSYAPCLGGSLHGDYRPIDKERFRNEFIAEPDLWGDGPWWDVYDLMEFGDGGFVIRAYCCVMRLVNLSKTEAELEVGKEYLTHNDLEYLLVQAANEYLEKDDMKL